MDEKILIAYASRYGSTKEVAESIGKIFRDAGIDVDVKNVNEVKSLSGYTGVIIGSAARAGKLLNETRKFAVKFRDDIQKLKTAYFTVCLTSKDETPDNRLEFEGYLDPLKEIKEPLCLGIFAGKLDIKSLRGFIGYVLKKAGIPVGDFRDWEEIDNWADEVIEKMLH